LIADCFSPAGLDVDYMINPARMVARHPIKAYKVDMARPPKTPDIFASFVDQLAQAIATRMGGGGKSNGAPPTGKRRGPAAGKKLDMSCRVAGCKNQSKGPRFGFMCADHMKLPKKEQQAARDAWKAKHA
jgi:hypothetical protein